MGSQDLAGTGFSVICNSVPATQRPIFISVKNNKTMAEEQNKETSKKSSSDIVIGIVVVVVVFTLIAIIGSSASSTNSTQTATSGNAVQTTDTQQSPCAAYSDANALAQNATPVSYKQLEKDPSSYMKVPAVFTGKVVQILESNGIGIIRLAVTKDSFGDWDTGSIVYVQYAGHNDVVDDDVVTVYGLLAGPQTYTSQANFQITVPSMLACFVTKKAPNAAAAVPRATQPAANVPSQPAAPAAQTNTGTWHTAFTYRNSVGFITTEPFSMQGSEWRTTITCSPSGPGTSRIVTYLDPVPSGLSVVGADSNCTQNPTVSYQYGNDPGQYSLQVTSVNSDYVVTIEDYY
jgi:hypothetical protein